MRTFSFSSASTLEARVTNFGTETSTGPILLSIDDSPITTETGDGSIARRQPWLAALLSDESTTIVDGTSAIVRAAMVGWADMHDIVLDGGNDNEGKKVQLLTSSYEPFGPENRASTRRTREFPDFDYPYFQGDRSGVTGCYIAASGAFLAVGIISILVAVLRIWAGPAELTSWTAQHVYLSQAGLLPSLAESSGLKSGYEVASPEKLGFLRIKVPLESTQGSERC